MYSVERKFKISVREVSPEKFGDALVGKIFERLTAEIRRVQVPAATTQTLRKEEPRSEARAVGINQAAELIGLSAATDDRLYRLSYSSGTRTIASVHFIGEL